MRARNALLNGTLLGGCDHLPRRTGDAPRLGSKDWPGVDIFKGRRGGRCRASWMVNPLGSHPCLARRCSGRRRNFGARKTVLGGLAEKGGGTAQRAQLWLNALRIVGTHIGDTQAGLIPCGGRTQAGSCAR